VSADSFIGIYFFYGLAFFLQGFTLLIKNVPVPLRFAEKALALGGIFGILHGTSEWLLMASLLNEDNAKTYIQLSKVISSISYFILAACAWEFRACRKNKTQQNYLLPLLAAIMAWLIVFLFQKGNVAAITYADNVIRWCIGTPAEIAMGIFLYRALAIKAPDNPNSVAFFRSIESLPAVPKFVAVVAASAILYGLTHILVPPHPALPFSVINNTLFSDIFGFDLAIFRALMAVCACLGTVAGLIKLNDLQWENLQLQVDMRTRELMMVNQELSKAVVAAERASTSKSVFLASMSHELRTPLNAVIGYSQILLASDTPRSARDHEYLNHIERSSRNLSQLLTDLLDVTTLEQSALNFDFEVVDVHSAIEEAAATLRLLAQGRRITITTTAPRKGKQLAVRANSQRLRQVLVNLIGNAVKYNHDGGFVTVYYVAEEDGLIKIVVEDSGKGIDDSFRDRVFMMFERGEISGPYQSKRIEGMGIGLAISKMIIDGMDGEIDFANLPGSGCQFWIRLPSA